MAVKLYWFWEEGGSSFEPHWARTMSGIQTPDGSLSNYVWIISTGYAVCVKAAMGWRKLLIMFSL